MKPLFSILMANYNNAEYISDAIESVLNQTYSNWELVIVDDGSDDNSIDVIKPFLQDKRIRLFRHKVNLGVGKTKKDMVSFAKGKIMGILDADDALDKDYVKIIVKSHLDNSDSGLVYFPHYNCDENLKNRKISKEITEIKDGKTNLEKPRVNGLITFKRSAYDKTSGFDPKLKKAVDRDLIYKLEEVTKLKFLNKPLYYYRKNKKGISQGENIRDALAYDALARYNAYKRRLHIKISNLTKKEISKELFSYGYYYLQKGDKDKAKYFIWKAIKANPNYKYIKTYVKRFVLKKK